MVCHRCKAVLDPDSRFCKHCGVTLQPQVQKIRLIEPAVDTRVVQVQRPSPPPAADVHRDPAQEQPVWEGRPAWRSYYGIWALWAVVCLVLLFQVWTRFQPNDGVRYWTGMLVLATGVGLGVRELLVVYGVRYRLTTQRLFIDRGILTRTTDQTELLRIDDVRLRQGIIDRLVNTGDVEVFTSDDTDENIVLNSVDQPSHVAEALRLHVRTMRGSQKTVYVDNV